MKVTSAYANKLIRGYREELAAIVSNERDTCTTTYGASETPIETGYNFTSTQDEMDALNDKISCLFCCFVRVMVRFTPCRSENDI